MKSTRSRLIFDVVLIASIVVLSFLPVVGSEAAQSLRIIAGIYTLFLVLANTILGRRSRLAVDLTFALFLGSMAWFEMLPVGKPIRETAIYAVIGGIVAMLGVWSGRQARPVAA